MPVASFESNLLTRNTWMSGAALRPQRGFVLPSCHVRGAVQFFLEELYTLRGILLQIMFFIPSLKIVDRDMLAWGLHQEVPYGTNPFLVSKFIES